MTLADQRGLTHFSALQVPYSLVERTVERELLPMARALELSVTTWAPLGNALLTGRDGSDRPCPTDTRIAGIGGQFAQRVLGERNLQIADAVNQVADARGTSSSQVALAWIRAQRDRAVLIPIVGVRTLAQLEDNLGALAVQLDAAEPEQLYRASAIELGFPHDFDTSGLVYGTTAAQIDNHR